MAKKKNVVRKVPYDQLCKLHAWINQRAGLAQAAQSVQAQMDDLGRKIAVALELADIKAPMQFEMNFKKEQVSWEE